MTEDEKVIDLLNKINRNISELKIDQTGKELTNESEKLFSIIEDRVDYSIIQIQATFDRIHDKVFNFNNILVGAYLLLGTFPGDKPILKLWTIIFPIINLAYMILIDVRQMEIHRFASKEMDWTEGDRNKYGVKIQTQTLLSLIAFLLSLACLLYVIIRISSME